MPRAPKSLVLEWNEAGWDELLTGIVRSELEPRAKRIAAECNKAVRSSAAQMISASEAGQPGGGMKSDRRAAHFEPPAGKDDYMVDSEGSNPLRLNDYRATVITVTERAKIDNARNHRLVRNLHLGGGG